MTLISLISFLFAVYGFQKILSEGKPMEPLRNLLVKLLGDDIAMVFFRCPLCVGWWSGAIIGIYMILMPDKIELYPLLPFIGAGFCRFLSDLTYFAHLGDIEEPDDLVQNLP